ncbi:MAG: hypothetical protein EXX96DRAFT_24647 [Benjaminiella poitrasii]|nr:MAG: hypothetical protein EXX96DRAFT_24647 [Benjaminiella poitrasii]
MWRSIAKYARQQIVQSDPNQIKEILKLWHLRLLALNKLGLCQLASAELEKLGNLDRPEFFDAEKEESFVPFELRILHAILPSYLKYPALTLERLSLLAIYCQKLSSRAKADSQMIWKYRELQTYLVLATHWIHLKDYKAAASTMQYILTRNNEDDVDIISSLGRLYLHIGDLSSANKMFGRVEEICKGKKEIVKEAIEMNQAFAFMSQGKWLQARDILQQLYNINHDNLLAINNLAVCEVYLGNLVKAIELLENLTLDNPTSAGTCETAIMNMCTLYELRHEDSTEKKIQVMKQVARWAGDSFQPDCIKLQ